MNGNIQNARDNADGFKGGYKEIITVINNILGILDAVTRPCGEAVQILMRMALDHYTLSMNTDYKEDFSALANAANGRRKADF